MQNRRKQNSKKTIFSIELAFVRHLNQQIIVDLEIRYNLTIKIEFSPKKINLYFFSLSYYE
jgi:hypothetical protein